MRHGFWDSGVEGGSKHTKKVDRRGSNDGYSTVIIGKNNNDGSSILSSDKPSNDMAEVQILSFVLEVRSRF